MSITVLFRGKKRRFATRFSVRKFLSVVVLSSLVLLISSRSSESVFENHVRVNVVKTGLEGQAKLVQQLQIDTTEQIKGIVNQLATMQSQINKLDTKTGAIAESAGLTKEDFVLSEELKAELSGKKDFTAQIETMSKTLEFKIEQLNALESILMGLNIEKESELSGRPVSKGWLSSYYGVRKDPFSGKPAMHKGIDFAGKSGDDVVATGAGVVTWSGERYGYGYLVEIDHGNGIRTRYGHNKELKVAVGDIVTKGQSVALLGNTGRSTGAHVHYEVLKNGEQVDPLPYIYR
ncbi:M23 family metallopeptidase [Glaciecola sp. KUL10]|uniref:M23 family metallopeptidase n=1 Tax=Glaciecola sp. (strain KUL10) TaxID=2161813 RepID=UPI000D78872F|nr:M23 family metallopeptidase [Glaciecola sp. KUL10]GBL05629.1 peptidase M23B [Glaciecola sp. KUL10]